MTQIVKKSKETEIVQKIFKTRMERKDEGKKRKEQWKKERNKIDEIKKEYKTQQNRGTKKQHKRQKRTNGGRNDKTEEQRRGERKKKEREQQISKKQKVK